MDWSNDLCFWVVLHLLQPLLFSMSSMYWKWRNFDQFNDNRIHSRMYSSVDVPVEFDRPAGGPAVGVGRGQRLHRRRLQWPTSRVCVNCELGTGLWLHELRPLYRLVGYGLGEPERDEYGLGCAYTHLLRPKEHLGARL